LAGTAVALAPSRTEPAARRTRASGDIQGALETCAAGAAPHLDLGRGRSQRPRPRRRRRLRVQDHATGGAPSDARTANILYGAGAALAIASAALFVFEF